MATNGHKYLKLAEDETHHLQQIPQNVEDNLILAENAAVISLNGLVSIEHAPMINSNAGLILLLLAKSAKSIRFATKGLKLGYYSDAYSAIRSSIEAVSYAYLFEKVPDEINRFFILEFSDKYDEQRGQLDRAKSTLISPNEKRCGLKSDLCQFVRDANASLHSSLEGLAEEFGVDVSLLWPDDFQNQFEKTGGDFHKAMDRFKLLNTFGKNILENNSMEQVKISPIELTGRFDKEILEYVSVVALFAAHRILDGTKFYFDIKEPDFVRDYEDWHHNLEEHYYSG